MPDVWGTPDPHVGVRWHARAMAEFRNQDLSGSVFDDVDLTGTRFSNVLLRDVTIRGAWAERLSIDGVFEELLFNGIDVVPLWRAELTRQHPEFARLEPDDADGYREIWPLLEEQWAATVARARRLPEDLLHERVDGEWSFIETLRHMLFVTRRLAAPGGAGRARALRPARPAARRDARPRRGPAGRRRPTVPRRGAGAPGGAVGHRPTSSSPSSPTSGWPRRAR